MDLGVDAPWECPGGVSATAVDGGRRLSGLLRGRVQEEGLRGTVESKWSDAISMHEAFWLRI